MADQNLLLILANLFASDAQKLPDDLVAPSLLLRHQFLDIPCDSPAYLQLSSRPSESIHASLQSIRESGQQWELDAVDPFHYGCREDPSIPELLFRTKVFIPGRDISLLVILSYDKVAESASAEWRFLTLASEANPFPAATSRWFLHRQEAMDAHDQAAALDEDLDDDVGEYWGETLAASSTSQDDKAESDNESWKKSNDVEDKYWHSFAEHAADSPYTRVSKQAPAATTATTSVASNLGQHELLSLRQSMQGVLNLWLAPAATIADRRMRLQAFQELASEIGSIQLGE